MRYWWVNQNQTWRHEVAGGYLWSPKRKANGSRNPFYEFMREVAPGDLVFSFAETRILAVGVATSYAYEAAKPVEFGAAGRNWEAIGWRVDVSFQQIPSHFRPKDWIELLRPLMPSKYAPLDANGNGSQSIYLTELPRAFALQLADLISAEIGALARSEQVAEPTIEAPNPELELWEEHIRHKIAADTTLPETDKAQLIVARRGQGLFRTRVQQFETRCRITGVDRPEHLRASHTKPWRDATNEERLDGANGLLLTPSIDHLFDRGFISFRNDGRLLVSPVAHHVSLERMGVPVATELQTPAFTARQSAYLEFHRDAVFLQASTRAG